MADLNHDLLLSKSKQFGKTQLDYSKAEKVFSYLLDHPAPKGYKLQKQKIKDLDLRLEWKKFFKLFNELVEIETSLHYYLGIKGLEWQS